MDDATRTREVIASMLTENTGRHMLDSGGAYGRHWERNQDRNFQAEQESVLSVKHGYLDVTHNLYHWLVEKLEFSEDMQRLFNGFVKWYDNRNYEQGWLFYADEFPAWLAEKFGVECAGLYGDSSGPMTVNTYNGEDLLSQTIQYVYFELQEPVEFPNFTVWDGVYVLLQIHGGCDVRGGYTAPKCFTLNDECGIFFNANATIWVEGDDIYWSTDDGYHYYEEGTCGYHAGPQLETYNIVEPDEPVEFTITAGSVKMPLKLKSKWAYRVAEFVKRWLNPPWLRVLDYELEPYIINDDGTAIWPKTMGQMYSSF